MTDGLPDHVWVCPWCEIALPSEADAYDHAYAHKDKAPYAHIIVDACFEKIDVVETAPGPGAPGAR